MRVIAGKYKKRQLKVPKSQLTRPTTDKNKENLFNMIGPYFQGGTVLDLFGGSGGLGIEAISRGCDTLYSVDHQYEAFKTIKENFSLLKLENCFPLKMDYKKALKYLYEKGIKFDYVFLDPPYDCVFSDYGNEIMKDGFGEERHRKLAEDFRKLKCKVLMVIGKTQLTEELYGDLIVAEYEKSYAVNIRNRFKSESQHILVTNYGRK